MNSKTLSKHLVALTIRQLITSKPAQVTAPALSFNLFVPSIRSILNASLEALKGGCISSYILNTR